MSETSGNIGTLGINVAVRTDANSVTSTFELLKQKIDESTDYLTSRAALARRMDNPYGTAVTGSTVRYEELTKSLKQEQAALDAKKLENARQFQVVQEELQRAAVRTMTTEQRINYEYTARLSAIRAIEGLTEQQTAELMRQAALVRQQTMLVERQRGNLSQIAGADRRGVIFQELGRGIEDFAIGFSMAKTNVEGLALGLRGSANNISQMASGMGPVIAASVAIGASLATVIVPATLRWLYNTDEIEKKEKAVAERLKEQISLLDKIEAARFVSNKQALEEDKTAVKRIGVLREQQAGLRERLVVTTNPKFQTAIRKSIADKEKEINEIDAVARVTLQRANIERERQAKEEERDQERQFVEWVIDVKKKKQEELIAKQKQGAKELQDWIDNDLAAKRAVQQDRVQVLQEQIQKAGTANGPSAALFRGTQAAESAIAKALAGTRSQEDTLKAQLKVEQDILKTLQTQNKPKTVQL